MRRACTIAFALVIACAGAASAEIDPTARGLALQAQQRDAIPAIFNYKDDYLVHYHAACAQVRTGDARCKIAVVADSTGAGWGAGSPTLATGARARSFPTYLARALSARGLPAQVDNVFGDGAAGISPDLTAPTPAGYAAAYTAYDPRVTFAGGAGSWTIYAINVPGGGWIDAPAGTTQVLSFASGTTIDRCEVAGPTNSGLGAADLQFDGGAATTISEAGAQGMVTASIAAASPGSHVLTITPRSTNTSDFYLQSIDCWNGASPAVSIANMGWPNSQVAAWIDAGAAWRTLKAVPYWGASLTIVELGINDWKDGGTGVAAFRANYQTLITNLKAGGSDVLIVVPFPSSTTRASVAQQAAYAQVLYDLARANNAVLVDMTKRFGSYALQAGVAPAQYADVLHPKATVYANAAQLIASVLMR